ncbi:hypothetical protein FBY39_3145 [Microbacterium sp. SLBN-146]|nr:hypothetical protein FBY39_3145 [Microbacterium sp. SLBN-146]
MGNCLLADMAAFDTWLVGFDFTKIEAFDITRMDEFQGAAERVGVAFRAGGFFCLGVMLAGFVIFLGVSGAPIFGTIAFGVLAIMMLLGAARWALAWVRSRPRPDEVEQPHVTSGRPAPEADLPPA